MAALRPGGNDCLTRFGMAYAATGLHFHVAMFSSYMLHALFEYDGPALLVVEGKLGTLLVGSEIVRRWATSPEGIVVMWKKAWDSCGRPGGGLKDKIKNWWRNPLRLPRPSPVPVARRVLVREPNPFRFSPPEIDLKLPEFSPEALRNAAMATATVIIIGGMILLAPVGI